MPLTQLRKLRKLSLRGEIEKLPEAAGFTANLTKLTLASSRLNQKALEKIGKQRNLCTLKLLWKSYMGKEMIFHGDLGFARLEYLRLEGLPNLEKLRFEKGAMPSLVSLNVNLCVKLKMRPEGQEHLASLRKWKERCLKADMKDLTDEESLELLLLTVESRAAEGLQQNALRQLASEGVSQGHRSNSWKRERLEAGKDEKLFLDNARTYSHPSAVSKKKM
ncbi:hypothetical protein ACLOJK_030325 [Asimina triloba]